MKLNIENKNTCELMKIEVNNEMVADILETVLNFCATPHLVVNWYDDEPEPEPEPPETFDWWDRYFN